MAFEINNWPWAENVTENEDGIPNSYLALFLESNATLNQDFILSFNKLPGALEISLDSVDLPKVSFLRKVDQGFLLDGTPYMRLRSPFDSAPKFVVGPGRPSPIREPPGIPLCSVYPPGFHWTEAIYDPTFNVLFSPNPTAPSGLSPTAKGLAIGVPVGVVAVALVGTIILAIVNPKVRRFFQPYKGSNA